MYGLKWESPENVGTKSDFSPNINYKIDPTNRFT